MHGPLALRAKVIDGVAYSRAEKLLPQTIDENTRRQRIFRRDVPFVVGTFGTFHFVMDKKVCGLDANGGYMKSVGYGNC